MKVKHLPVIILGTAGGAKDIYYWIKQCNMIPETNGMKFNVIGFVGKHTEEIGNIIADGIKVISSDDTIEDKLAEYQQIGMVLPFGSPIIKQKVYDKFNKYKSIVYPTIVHPSVIYDKSAGVFGQGNIIGAGTIIASEYVIGDFNYISINSTLGHDIKIGNFNAINPMTTISGNVTIGNHCLIGAGSTVLQELSISDGVTLGAGAVLTTNAEQGKTLVGVPAKVIEKR